MRPSILLFCAVLASVAFGACERKISESNLKVLKPDMTAKEVESVLGAPTRIVPGPEITREPQTLLVTTHIYEQNGKKIELRFVGDRLATAPTDTDTNAPAVTGTLGK